MKERRDQGKRTTPVRKSRLSMRSRKGSLGAGTLPGTQTQQSEGWRQGPSRGLSDPTTRQCSDRSPDTRWAESFIEGRWLSWKFVSLTKLVMCLFLPPSVSSAPTIGKLKLEQWRRKERAIFYSRFNLDLNGLCWNTWEEPHPHLWNVSSITSAWL